MNNNKIHLERRRFLKTVGASALTYPFLRGLPSYAAAGGSAPTYMILIFTPCGVVRPLWGAQDANGNDVLPPAIGSPAAITTGFQLRNTLMPFSSLQSKMIILDGINNKAAQGSHEAGMASLWTGQISTGSPATKISIDQAIAGQLNAPTAFPTIQLMVRSAADFTDREVKTRMLYNAAGTFVDPIDDPTSAAASIFPTTPTTGGPDKNTYIRQQLFTQLNSELSALEPKLCTDDRAQLQALQDGWNNLNTQLQAAAAAAANCTAPPPVPSTYSNTIAADFPQSAQLQSKILALAIACGLTRVASLQFSTATSQVTHTWLGSNQTDTHHNYSHQGPTSLYSLTPCTSYNNQGKCSTTPDMYTASNQNLYQNLAQQKAIDNWYAQQVANLAMQLDAFPGTGGGTLLDQSVICWGSELDMGAAHNHDDTPFLLVGGANGQLKTGQMVTFPLDFTSATNDQPAQVLANDRSHNDLLLTLAQVMGAPMTTFGEPSYCTGPIKEILNS
jgi:uncharacterized protein DUF1552